MYLYFHGDDKKFRILKVHHSPDSLPVFEVVCTRLNVCLFSFNQMKVLVILIC